MSDETANELNMKLDKLGNLMEAEGSYINITQDIERGTLNISVTPKSIVDGSFDKVMDKVLEYVNLYAEKIASQHNGRKNDDIDDMLEGYS